MVLTLFFFHHQVQGPQTDCSPSLTRNFPHWRQLENRTELARKETASIRRMGPDQASAPRVSLTSPGWQPQNPLSVVIGPKGVGTQYFFSYVVKLVCVYLCKSYQDSVCSSGFLVFMWAICMYLHISTTHYIDRIACRSCVSITPSIVGDEKLENFSSCA